MNRIVNTGVKIDLHIHSCASSKKDGKKVKNNTLERIPLLIEKLNENEVNICAITDHDTFSYEMYSTLKKAEKDDSSIQKVLPGVEFTVSFLDDNQQNKSVHVVSIFSDKDESKIKSIEKILIDNPPSTGGFYMEEDFLKILRLIDIDTILIAHQKNTLSTKKVRDNDVNALGENKFLELVESDFFESYEFKNKRHEILNKNHLAIKNMQDKVRFVTGTDCHDWSVYPKEDASDELDVFPYTYAKCLPTFKGLVMAVTNNRRLKRVDSFFNVDKFTLDSINIEKNGKKLQIPLSKGINVIIGDNSIGKSMLLHSLTGFEKDGEKLEPKIKSGYQKYAKDNSLKIKKQLSKDNVFHFDMQGEVRKKFESNQLVATEFSKYFPKNIDPKPYQSIIENEINNLINFLDKKFSIEKEMLRLTKFDIHESKEFAESLSFVGNVRSIKKDSDIFKNIQSKIKQVDIDIDEVLKLNLDELDADEFRKIKAQINGIKTKYIEKEETVKKENSRIESVAKNIDKAKKRHDKIITDEQKLDTTFIEKTNSLKESIIKIIKQSQSLPEYKVSIESTAVKPATNPIQEYNFISKINVDVIDSDYFSKQLKKVFRANKKIDFNIISEKALCDSLLHYDRSIPVLQFFKDALLREFEKDFEPKNTITLNDMDATRELSAGLNAKIYFDLLSYESNMEGIYIIDQPEDNVSQPSIKEYLLDCFSAMSDNRQIIMVSHNPQFIVNLDIDNLIYLSKTETGELTVKYGALEYENDDYSILDIVANNIDGGLDTIQKRWKRYEKINKI